MATSRIKPFKARFLSLGQQLEALMRDFPGSKGNLSKNSKLVWIARVLPSPLSCIYTIQLIYQIGKRPTVQVVEPVLVPRQGEKLPHVFAGKILCLYRARYGEWDPSKYLSMTIVPWASLWLLHYEIWHSTGSWGGSRAEHPTR